MLTSWVVVGLFVINFEAGEQGVLEPDIHANLGKVDSSIDN